MKFHYYADTDSLYIDLSDRTGADSVEVSPGVKDHAKTAAFIRTAKAVRFV